MMDLTHFIRKEGKCCSCEGRLTKNRNINFVTLDKYAQWKFPTWGNIRALDEDKKTAKRAVAILCDGCINSKSDAKLAVEIVEEAKGRYSIYYHDVESLLDAPPIVESDLEAN